MNKENINNTVPIKISIDDGFVEYSFNFDVGSTHSIHTLLGMICSTLDVSTPPKGVIRRRVENN